MTDDLENKTDTELNELFAVEIATMERLTHLLWVFPGGLAQPLTFCTDANAVLPWLEKWHVRSDRITDHQFGARWHITIFALDPSPHENGAPVAHCAAHASLARAAVTVLLRAKRAEKS
jgi:hypothetical protein